MPKHTTIPVSSDQRLPTSMVADRFHVATRTVERWMEDPLLNFPQPLLINKRRYWSLAELENWERVRAATGA